MRATLCLLLLLALLLAPGGEPRRCQAGELPFVIGGWIGPHQSEEQFRLYRDAGFNTVLDYPWEGDRYLTTLELARRVGGLGVILNVWQQFLAHKPEETVPAQRLARFVSEVRGRREVIGYNLFDEPKPKEADLVVQAGQYLRSLDPDRPIWLSFFLHNDRLADSILQRYLPGVISAPHYPYVRGGEKLEEMYRTLESYRELALRYRVPLWLFVQSSSWPWPQHLPDERRAPTPEEIRMQVYSNLAYGAKGLWYFTYATPRHAPQFSSVLLDREDRVKPAYAAVRALNLEVQALGPLLLTLDSVQVMHVRPRHQGVRPFQANPVLSAISGEELLVGFFKDKKGGDYFLLSNKRSDRANQVRLQTGRQVSKLSRIDKTSGLPVPLALKKGGAELTLEPGDGMLIKVN